MKTFLSEIKTGGHLSTLVISPEQKNAFGEVYFERNNKKHNFRRKNSSIHKIAQKQIFCVFGRPTLLQELQQIIVLTMNISYYCNGVLNK